MRKCIHNQTHSKSEVLLAVLTNVAFQDFTESLILSTWHGYFKNNAIMTHNTSEHSLKHVASDSRWLNLCCSVFTVHTKYSAFVETNWFDYRKQRLWSCLYCHPSACRYQIFLRWIVEMLYLKKLLFELLVWVSYKTVQWILA